MFDSLLASAGSSVPQVVLIAVLGLAVFIVLMLLLRQVFCWYWKINKTVRLLQSIERKLAVLSNTPSIEDKQR
ncbi:MAG: hypothetical protein WC224_00760 [Sphaerochaetaceae bacterium]